jgi:hypothetical protein
VAEILTSGPRDHLASILSFSHVTPFRPSAFFWFSMRVKSASVISAGFRRQRRRSLLCRPLLGRVSDKIGRGRALACFALRAALATLAFSSISLPCDF